MMTSTSQKVHAQFVGRQDALDAFYLRFAYRHMKNGIYYCGGGGLGKTWILHKIINDNNDDPIRMVTRIIDFSDTQNHSVRGLQSTIKSRLQNPAAFKPYDKTLERLDEAKKKTKTQSSVIASLESRANEIFIRCCQEAIHGKEVILLFDTFERVQQRYVGQWLRQDFVHRLEVGDLIVAIAGRPEPILARMPDNIVVHELPGLTFDAYTEFIHNRLPSASNQMVESLWKHTGGAPLMGHLILDLSEQEREQFIAGLNTLGENEIVQNLPNLQKWLAGQFTDSHEIINKVMWAMAYLRRRFDINVLKYIVENTTWFIGVDYETILSDLGQSVYVKEFTNQQSHLLHDEIQRLVAEYVLPEIGIADELQASLYDAMINGYYPETIKTIENTPPSKMLPVDLDLIRQLQAEQLGYILDQEPDVGLKEFENYRDVIEKKTYNYDFEELLWGEVREHLDAWPEHRAYEISQKRGIWLRRNSLFQKAEEHFLQMLDRFSEKKIETQEHLGFVLMRQGKIREAQTVFKESRSLVPDDDLETIARIESVLGQAARRAGEWDMALDHYANSFRAATMGRNDARMASVYLNRGYLYALLGYYAEAKSQCERAIALLKPLPESRDNQERMIYALMNLGTAYRYSGEYSTAIQHYKTSLEIAEQGKHQEAMCSILQHMGVSEYSWGRGLRRDGQEFAQACGHQLQAWKHIVNAMEIAQRSDSRNAIADGLNRLGKVYREIHRLQTEYPQMDQPTDSLSKLQKEALAYQPPFEVEFEYSMLTTKQFADANWLEKAARLFEISGLIADDVNDFHRALESWTETARLVEELGMDDMVPLFIKRIDRIKGYDYQQALFGAISEFILADLDFKHQNLGRALEKYTKAYADLAEQSGYAIYLLIDRLIDLEWRVLTLEPEIALNWCNLLEGEWMRRSVLAKRPEMRDTIERIRVKALRKQKE
jgi:tetratricopeptide (TPR) repeat protein